MPLRILEEKRKFEYHRLQPKEKDQIVKTIHQALKNRREIMIAVIFGGFLKDKAFRDIDIAIYTNHKVPYEKVEQYQEKLSQTLEQLAKLPIDVVVIDYAPPWFKAKALNGITIIEREVALTARLKFKSRQEVIDIQIKKNKLKTKTSKL